MLGCEKFWLHKEDILVQGQVVEKENCEVWSGVWSVRNDSGENLA